ncbi:MAG: hypothetical protein WB810_13855 [Candidatus Cybelea sp.]
MRTGLTPTNRISPAVLSHHRTFLYTGAEQNFKVPNGVTRVTVVARGAAGGGYPGSRGGRVFAVIPVTSGERLAIFVGGAGSWPRGGFDGGAKGGKSLARGIVGP